MYKHIQLTPTVLNTLESLVVMWYQQNVRIIATCQSYSMSEPHTLPNGIDQERIANVITMT